MPVGITDLKVSAGGPTYQAGFEPTTSYTAVQMLGSKLRFMAQLLN